MAIHHDCKERTDWRPGLLHKKKRRFRQAEPLALSKVGSMQSCLQALSAKLTPVMFIPSRNRYALSLIFRSLETHARNQAEIISSQLLLLLRAAGCLKPDEASKHHRTRPGQDKNSLNHQWQGTIRLVIQRLSWSVYQRTREVVLLTGCCGHAQLKIGFGRVG